MAYGRRVLRLATAKRTLYREKTPMTEVSLWFAGEKSELIRCAFCYHRDNRIFISVRGKTTGAQPGQGSFQWTSAVRAVSSLFLREKLFGLSHRNQCVIEGTKGSLASSLDYAMYKEPNWLCDMMGTDRHGRSLSRRLLLRTNAGQKRPGIVTISLNRRYLDNLKINIFWDGEDVCESSFLEHILSEVEQLPRTESMLPTFPLLAAEQDRRNTHLGCRGCRRNKPYLTEALLNSDMRKMSFSQEWLGVVNGLASETTSCLRGMVHDSQVKNWWQTFSGKSYLLSNVNVLKAGRKIKRLYLLSDQNPEVTSSVISNAYLNHLLGINVRLCNQRTFCEISPYNTDMFSVHDTTFGALHNIRTQTDESFIVDSYRQVAEMCDCFDTLFHNDRLSLHITDILKDHVSAAVIKHRADSELEMIKKLSA
jgi:hypothetical protein